MAPKKLFQIPEVAATELVEEELLVIGSETDEVMRGDAWKAEQKPEFHLFESWNGVFNEKGKAVFDAVFPNENIMALRFVRSGPYVLCKPCKYVKNHTEIRKVTPNKTQTTLRVSVGVAFKGLVHIAEGTKLVMPVSAAKHPTYGRVVAINFRAATVETLPQPTPTEEKPDKSGAKGKRKTGNEAGDAQQNAGTQSQSAASKD